MSNIYRNPNNSYSHRTVEIPPNSRVLFISGQTATDENGKTPADPDIQAEIVYKKILESLEQADMTKDNLVKTNVYITDPKFAPSVYKASQKYNPLSKQAGTLVYVKALATPEVLIEIDAIAAKK